MVGKVVSLLYMYYDFDEVIQETGSPLAKGDINLATFNQ